MNRPQPHMARISSSNGSLIAHRPHRRLQRGDQVRVLDRFQAAALRAAVRAMGDERSV